MSGLRPPAAFFGHGSPMNALESNRYTTAWREFGAELARPRAVLVVSAHWYINGVAVTAMERPRTIHDFSGFPAALFGVEYPAPGSPEVAAQVAALLGGNDGLGAISVDLDSSWGLDHGAWSVLVHVFPGADVPVVQLSIDRGRPAAWHWDVAARLSLLRDDGVMILGSGNITHNFGELDTRASGPAEWAVDFDRRVWSAIEAGDRDALVEFDRHPDGLRAAPTPEHYLPLLYVAGAAFPGERSTSIVSGMDLGSFSMRSFAVARADV